jgi:hypothetical protein
MTQLFQAISREERQLAGAEGGAQRKKKVGPERPDPPGTPRAYGVKWSAPDVETVNVPALQALSSWIASKPTLNRP